MKIAFLDNALHLNEKNLFPIGKSVFFTKRYNQKKKKDHAFLMLKTLFDHIEFPKHHILLNHYIVLDENNNGSEQNYIRAIEEINSEEVDMLCIPSGCIAEPMKLKNTLKDLQRMKNCQIVAAAGNPYLRQKSPLYPAAWNFVTSVAEYTDTKNYENWTNLPDVIEPKSITLATTNENGSSYACMRHCAFLLNNHYNKRFIKT